MDILVLLFYTLLGTLIAATLSLIPALHIFNVAAFIVLIIMKTEGLIPYEALPVFMMSMVVAFSILNTVPALFLGAPDESAIWMVLPGQKYMMLGRGYEAVVLSGIGALGAIVILGLMTPISFRIFPVIKNLLRDHMFWVLTLISAYIIMSEWPKATLRPKTKLGRFIDGWKSCSAGLLTFILAGALGLIVFNKTLVPIDRAFQSITPVFVGLFAVPWVLINIISKNEIPPQYISNSVDVDANFASRGIAAGALGGAFAALFPVVTGGIGGLLAGHATAQRDDRIFIISQGASKTLYYVGAFLLLFVPALSLRRGGMAWILSPIYSPRTISEYVLALAAIAIAGGLSCILLLYYSRLIIKLITRVNYRLVSFVTLFILLGIVFAMAGPWGIFIMIPASGIGLIPVLFHSRRMNCMAVLLVPMILNMAGLGPKIVSFLRLV
ncbi:tripartite tricarboxylate transporter permease [bacterium]|nr:tripartite tricarboxylate transporter permease [bacterium]